MKGVLLSVIIAGGLLYAIRAFRGSFESALLVGVIIVILIAPRFRPAWFPLSLVVAAIVASSSFALSLVFAPLLVQVGALLMLGVLIGYPLRVLIKKQRIRSEDAQWLPVFAAVYAAIMGISIVGPSFIGRNLSDTLGLPGPDPWLSLLAPSAFYASFTIVQIGRLEWRSLGLSALVFACAMSLVVFGLASAGIA